MDNVISNVKNDYRYHHFPLLSEGRKTHANHWTLGVLDIKSNAWYYYNSLRPRTNAHKGPYKTDFEVMVHLHASNLNSEISSFLANICFTVQRKHVDEYLNDKTNLPMDIIAEINTPTV
mgnify:CR=1 FL=1